MALVREVVECLLNSQKGEIALSFDNFDEAISRSKVEDGRFVRFTPGVYDPAVARFVFEVKGVKFVRGRDDPSCAVAVKNETMVRWISFCKDWMRRSHDGEECAAGNFGTLKEGANGLQARGDRS